MAQDVSPSGTGADQPQVSQLIRKYASQCQRLLRSDMRILARLCESGMHFLGIKARQLVAAAGGAPVLISYSSDGTPVSTKKRATAKSSSDVQVSRTGRTTDEYLVEHAFVRYVDAGGQHHSTVVLKDPLPLTNGKSAWALYACATNFIETARAMGHTGISVCHYAFDRAAYSALARHLRHRHQIDAASRASQSSSSASVSSRVLELTEWVISTPCGLHDIHNSLKWSIHARVSNTEVLKDCFLVIESLRNSADLLHRHLGGWLEDRLRFVPEEDLPAPEHLYELWTSLGVEHEVADILATELRLQWKGGNLEVSEAAAEIPNIVGQASFALLSVWRFRVFSDSRWVSVGCSCRALAASLLTGIDSLVAYIRKNPTTSDYDIHGFDRLNEDVRHFVALAAMVSYPSDALLSELLEDSRIPRRLAALTETVDSELDWLASVGSHVWEPLASMASRADLSGQVLRSECLHAAHISRGFMQHRFFAAASEYPWRLATGDQDANLASLMSGPKPAEECAGKIWELLHLGFNKNQIKQGLELVLDAPWGTASAEQQHASATLIKKHHKEYNTETLRLRSLCHTLRLILPTISVEDKQIHKAQASLAKLSSKRPQNFGGRQLYLRDLMRVAKDWKKTKARELPGNVSAMVMKRHGKSWTKMSAKARQSYELQALIARSESESQISDAVEETRAQLSVMSSRNAARKCERPPLLLSTCAISDEDEVCWTSLLQSKAFNDSQVQQMRRISVAPALPSAAHQLALNSVALGTPDTIDMGHSDGQQPWLGQVCSNRAYFAESALVFETEAGQSFYKFLFAMQRPFLAMFSLLKEDAQYFPCPSAAHSEWQDDSLAYYERGFTVDFHSSCSAEALPRIPMERIQVLSNLVHLGGLQTVVSDSDLVPLETFLANLPPLPPRAARDPKPKPADKVSPKAKEDLVAKHPWLQHHFEANAKQPPKKSASKEELAPAASQEDSDSEADGTPEVQEDSRVEDVFEELRQKREQWHLQGDVSRVDFRVSLLGGAWQQRVRGKAYDSFRGQALKGEAGDWCILHSFQKTARFEVATHGETTAATLAEAWCHRMQYFFSLHKEATGGKYKYSASDLANYEEPKAFQDLFPTLSGKSLQRALRIRELNPRL